MKKFIMIFVLCFAALSFKGFSQLKVTNNGYVGIITTNPAYKLDVNSGESRSWYTDREPLFINHWGTDPRICSDTKVVFYKPDGSGYINISCLAVYQASDSTAKENISPLTDDKSLLLRTNIAKIQLLRGVNYNWKNDATKKLQAGFLAQEVEKVIPEAVITTDSTKYKSLSYSAIIPYLVEAIKEQQFQIEALKDEIEYMNVNCCQSDLKSASFPTETSSLKEKNIAFLNQNIPNPFNIETKISCYIPSQSNTVVLYIYNMQGAQLQQYDIQKTGYQTITIKGNSLNPGIYLYTLVVDGKEIDTKRMILTKN